MALALLLLLLRAGTSVVHSATDVTKTCMTQCPDGFVLCDAYTDPCITVPCGRCVETSQADASCQDRQYSFFCSSPLPTFKCARTPNCVLSHWLLNGNNDCGDWSDEDPCLVRSFGLGTCSLQADCKYDACAKKLQCTCPAGYVGDGTSCVRDMVLANTTNVPPASTATASKVTAATTSTARATSTTLERSSFNTVAPMSSQKVSSSTPLTTSYVSTATVTGRGTTIPTKLSTATNFVGAAVCNSRSYEKMCHLPMPTYRCANTSSCVPMEWLLDGVSDCDDHSDEDECLVEAKLAFNHTCSPLADCSYNRQTKIVRCTCRPGYTGNGVVCAKALPPPCNCSCCANSSLCNNNVTVIQRHLSNDTVNYMRSWSDYRNGFGQANGSFWLGNERVYSLTSKNQSHQLIITLVTVSDRLLTIVYDQFSLSSEKSNYTLQLGSFCSPDQVDDYLASSRGQPFGTYDRDTDKMPVICGLWWQSGWWHDPYCGETGNLNLPMQKQVQFPYLDAGVEWTINGTRMVIASTEMKIVLLDV